MSHQPGTSALRRSGPVRTVAAACTVVLLLASCGDDTTSDPLSTEVTTAEVPTTEVPTTEVPTTDAAPTTAPAPPVTTAPPMTTAPPPVTAAPPATAGSSDSGDAFGAGEGVGSEFCNTGQTLDAMDLDISGTPAELQASIEMFLPLIEQSVEQSPDRYRPFLTRVAEFYDAFYNVLVANGFDATAALSDPAGVLSEFDDLDDDPSGIGDELDAYCGIES